MRGRVMRSLIAIAALLASVPASAGELDGKGIICLATAETGWSIAWEASGNHYTAYLFDDDTYRHQYLWRDGTRMKIVNSELTSHYSAEAGKVYLAGAKSTLDRRTLELTNRDGLVKQCEAYANLESLEAALEEIRRSESEALKAYMRQNKI